jgi:radical SAM superfamily enzyme YgiQ (UPF0313 family)
MRVHLINPSDVAFGVGVITPRWLYVLAGATQPAFGDPVIVDETLEPLDDRQIQHGDVVGIGIHSANALAGYKAGKKARERGATVVFGGIHATLYPEEPHERGGAHSVVRGDGDVIWAKVLADCVNGGPTHIYEAGRAEGGQFQSARWDLMPPNSYMWASVQTVRGCPKHCSFCSVWRTDGQRPRQNPSRAVIREIVELRRMGFRFIALADDNFYPVTLTDLEHAARQEDKTRLRMLEEIRADRFQLMAHLAELPSDMVFFTQITMEAAEDSAFLDAMRKANIKGALVGVESVTPEGLKDVYKDFNLTGESLVRQLRKFREHGVYVLGSFIFGLPSDTPETFEATAALAQEAGMTFAQFVTLTPFPGTVDFMRWEQKEESKVKIAGIPLNRYWLIPGHLRPKLYTPHPLMTHDEIRRRTQDVWDEFYNLRNIWKRVSGVAKSIRARLALVFVSKLYRQMYARTGIATDSARRTRANTWARLLAKPCRRLFQAPPMPELKMPESILD